MEENVTEIIHWLRQDIFLHITKYYVIIHIHYNHWQNSIFISSILPSGRSVPISTHHPEWPDIFHDHSKIVWQSGHPALPQLREFSDVVKAISASNIRINKTSLAIASDQITMQNLIKTSSSNFCDVEILFIFFNIKYLFFLNRNFSETILLCEGGV